VTIFGRKIDLVWLRSIQYSTFLVALIGASLSLVAYDMLERIEHERETAHFALAANHPVANLSNKIQTNLAAVQSLVAFYESSDFVSRKEFDTFALSVLDWHSNLQALEWLPKVTAKEREAFERKARSNGLKAFHITEQGRDGKLIPAHARSVYFPVFYMQPISGNEAALGFDLMSETIRRTTLETAIRLRRVSASQPITLVQGPENKLGILIAAPVFFPSPSTWYTSDLADSVHGIVLAVLRIDDLIETAIGPWADRVGTADIQMFATLSTGGRQLIFSSRTSDLQRSTSPALSQSVEIANQKWQVVIRTPPEWATTHDHWLPSLALIFGLTLTTIATLVYRLRLIGMVKLSALSASLEAQNQELRTVSQTLSKYLPRQLWGAVMDGESRDDISAKPKLLTIFISDIEGFTEISSTLDSANLTRLLNEYFAEMSQIAARHGATLDKYVGDAIIMFFGDPVSKGQKQDAINCVAMALEMQDRLVELRKKWFDLGHGDLFHARMAIHTGYCDVGTFGSSDRMSYTIIGLDVNITARVQKQGILDGVTVTETTYDLIKDAFDMADCRQVHLKGVRHKVCLRNVYGKKAHKVDLRPPQPGMAS
jgi:CHASE1-domain containing sensor protein/class 3 adenylate cyclase